MDDRTSVFVDAVQATRERMYRVARMMLRTDADAEDAVSTATMIAWKQLPRLRNLDALPAYLTRCTVNAARAALRRRKRETLMDAAHLPERPAQSGKDTPVWMYLQRLPEKYRKVWNPSFVPTTRLTPSVCRARIFSFITAHFISIKS